MTDLIKTVADLGRLKAKIADLTDRTRDLEYDLIDSGESEIEGKLFRVVISEFTKNNIAWKKIAEKLNASKRLISANTSSTDIVRVNINARKAA